MDILLVQCGFAGGWIWREVEAALRARGHRTHAPTLTGLGDRAHLASRGTGLDTHVDDLQAAVACERMTELMVVASGYGAVPAAGLAGRMPGAVRRLVWVDTLVPEPGQSWHGMLGPRIAGSMAAAVAGEGEGWKVPNPDAGKPPRWGPQPLKTMTDPLPPGDPAATAIPSSFLLATDRPADWFDGLGAMIDAFATTVRARGWERVEIGADHLPMLSAPGRLAELIDRIATA
jgi:hypothetical protein